MATTPPPGRLRTPPTPVHGAKYDSFEPYSPRRSRRVAAQRQQQHADHEVTGRHHSAHASTPTKPSTRASFQSSSQTFSPPSSPNSPHPKSSKRGRGRMTAGAAFADGGESNSDAPASTSKKFAARVDGLAMLPTPTKTPRKRVAASQSTLGAAARVLFPPRPATIDDAMPEPKRSRKARKNAFTLQSFAEDDLHESDNESIQIYTDFRERVPSVDGSEDNPFVGPRKPTKSKKRARKSHSHSPTESLGSDDEAKKMEEAARNDEGIIYVFRGRKIFRKFEDVASGDDAEHASDSDLRRKAGPTATRRLTRSSVKPRLLFPTEEELRARDGHTDEDASTEIDESKLPSHLNGDEAPDTPTDNPPEPAAVSTPAKKRSSPATPPTTVRTTRVRKVVEPIPSEAVDSTLSTPEAGDEASPVPTSLRSSKRSPFDAWRRAKPGSSAGLTKGTKREAEALEPASSKRPRSAGS